jgi:two-component system, sensor histidine kinase and response regulator
LNENPKILIVDDNLINIRVAAKILHDQNFNISFSLTGTDAIQKANKIDFDLILLDIMMPEMDGFEVIKNLKSSIETKHIPVIFLTAKSDPDNLVKAFELGGADYVTKPFNGKELLSRVETHIRLQKARQELEFANQKLRESNDTKDKMFSIISHDLLGPLGNIKESFELIASGEVKMDYDNLIDFIKTGWAAIGNAYSLLENLLYWARNQQGRMIYHPKPIQISSIIEETIGLLLGVANNKAIHIKTNIMAPGYAFADKNAIKTVLRNLISNAIKFTKPEGFITINVNDENDTMYRISVSDNGIGMSSEKASKLFSPGKKDHPEWGTAGEKGVGLGLVICKEFIEKHKGTIWVTSQLEKGSTFNFTLPKYKN